MKVIFITFLVAFSFSVASVAQEPVPLHEPDGKCHRPYQDPNDCRHPCDHTFCKCVDPCKDDCEYSEDKWCYDKCFKRCLRKNAECINKCCEDGKIEC